MWCHAKGWCCTVDVGSINKAVFLSSVAKDLGFHYAFAIKWQSETIGEALNYPETFNYALYEFKLKKPVTLPPILYQLL